MTSRSKVNTGIVKGVICAVVAIPSLYVLVTTLNACFSISFSSLYMDQWDNTAAYFQNAKDGQVLRWLFSFHNEHQILIPRLLFLADWSWFGGTNKFLIIWILANQAVFAFAFYHILRRTPVSALTNLTVIFVTLIFLYSSTQLENLSWGFQVQFVNVFLFAFLSVLFYCDYLSQRTWWQLTLTCVFAILSSFSMSNGFLIWPLLLFVAITHKAWKNLIGFGILFIFILSIYLDGNTLVGEALTKSSHSWKEGIDFIRFILIYLGNPMGKRSFLMATGFGLLSVLYLAFLSGIVFISKRKQLATPATKALIFSSLFILGSAFTTSIGRYQGGFLQATAERYTTPSLLFFSFLVVLTIVLLGNRDLKFGFRIVMLIWLTIGAVFTGYLIKRQSIYIFNYSNKHINTEIALTAIHNNSFDPYYFSFLHPRMENHIVTIEYLKNNKTFGKIHNLRVPDKPGIEQSDSQIAEVTQVYFLQTASLSGGTPSYIVYGGLRIDRKMKGEKLFLADSNDNWTGSGYVTNWFPSSWPFTEFERGDADLLFVVHLDAKIPSSQYKLYLDMKHELLKIGDLTTENLNQLEDREFYDLSKYSGNIPDYKVISMDPAWTEDGIYPAAPRPDTIALHYGTWEGGGDTLTGEFRISIDNLAGHTQMDIPYISGPMIPNGSITLINGKTSEVIDRVRPAANSSKWMIIRFDLPAGLESLDLVIREDGKGWGQWMGIGEPSLH